VNLRRLNQLRAVRLRQLEALNEQQGPNDSVMRVPDGVSLLSHQVSAGAAGNGTGLIGHDGSSSSSSSSSVAAAAASSESTPLEDIELRNPLSCYVCLLSPFLLACLFIEISQNTSDKQSDAVSHLDMFLIFHARVVAQICHKPYRRLHAFYDKLCPECADFNFKKREEMCDMTGKVRF
jgi:hypothetical protein